MASFEEHCQECLEKLSEDFAYIHKWLDESFSEYKGKIHRAKRHHQEGIEEVRRIWGEKAAEAAKIHIQRDYPLLNGEIPSKEMHQKGCLSMFGKKSRKGKSKRYLRSED